MADGSLEPAPIFTDVTAFDGRPWRGAVDFVEGGSPCQDLSVAGKRAGIGGKRSGLFGEYIRIVEEVQPSFVLQQALQAMEEVALTVLARRAGIA
jgi:DNA (cytosine-5)-methyltransferase 1